ncbi:MAG: AfsR/SARP family transcriptional regulator [Frankia sp.]
MEVGILGPLEVRGDDGRKIDIAGPRLRALLIRLALEPGRPVGGAALVEAVWGDEPPAEAAGALQTLVSRLRRALGVARVAHSPDGYCLTIHPDEVDAQRFERLAATGAAAVRAGHLREGADQLTAALTLWRGSALGEADAGPAAAAHATRLDHVRLTAILDRARANLGLGRPARAVAELDALVGAHPLHERLVGELMTALAASGRPADALHRYGQLRARLANELGVDPSAELRDIHLAVLRGMPAVPRPGAAPSDAAPPSDEAPAAGPARPTNLRNQLTSFVGRDDEVARIARSLGEGRLVTLVGPGGAGKTRLAGEAVAPIVDEMPDGVWFVELASVTDPADLAQTVLGSLGLRETNLLDGPTQRTGSDAVSRLLEGLADQQAVIVLDNCEHLIEAVASLADRLLSRCRDLRILATSREPLNILGEALLVVPPLAQPEPDAAPAVAARFPSVRLFIDRAAAVSPDFAVDATTVAPVIEIVRRLDGMPLAIELAAARLRTLPLAEIAERLSDRFRLLTGGSRTALPRHRTLRAVVEWSWDLLEKPERLLVERLAVFPSGTTTRSATAVCSGDGVPADDVADLLASLLDKSLLQPAAGGTRQRLLETIREYGLERLAGRGELADWRARHAAFFAELLRTAEPHLRRAEQLHWLAPLNAERDNILGALRFECERGDADAALSIAIGLSSMAMLLGNHADLAVWVAEALAVPGGEPDLRAVGEALYAVNSATTAITLPLEEVAANFARLGEIAVRVAPIDVSVFPVLGLLKPVLAMFSGNHELTVRSIAEARAGSDPWVSAAVLAFRANVAENDGDVEAMRADTVAALAEFRALGERWGTASTLRTLAQLHTLDGRLDDATAAYEEALALMNEMGSRDDEIILQIRLADLAIRRGDVAAARCHVEAAGDGSRTRGSALEEILTLSMQGELARYTGDLAAARQLQDQALRRLETIPSVHPIMDHGTALVRLSLARLAADCGDLGEAADHLRQSYDAALLTKDMPIVATVGVAVGDLAARTGQAAAAAEMLGASASLRGGDDATAPDVAQVTARLRDELGDGFRPAYQRGRALDRDAAIARLEPPRRPADRVGRLAGESGAEEDIGQAWRA